MSASLLLELLQSRSTYFALMVLGAGLFGYFLYEDYQLERVRQKYQSTPCVVQSSEVIERVTRSRRGGRQVSYHLDIRYTYEFNGKTYKGNAYRLSDMGMGEDEAFDVAEEFSPGRNRCFVDPDAPEKAVLSQASDMRMLYLVALFGILGLLLGVGGWVTVEFVIPKNSSRRETGLAENSEPVPLEIPAWSSLGKLQRNAPGEPANPIGKK